MAGYPGAAQGAPVRSGDKAAAATSPQLLADDNRFLVSITYTMRFE